MIGKKGLSPLFRRKGVSDLLKIIRIRIEDEPSSKMLFFRYRRLDRIFMEML